MTKIAIIGAGLSGLSVARLLKDYAEITIFEKSRGVGGRISTRRAEPWFFDHGAQYFTVRTEEFKDFIQPLLKQGIIKQWHASYVKFDRNKIIENQNWIQEEPRYVGVPGMNQFAKFLANGINIHLNTKILCLNYQDKWQLMDDQGYEYSNFDWVICTIPSPQAVNLLPKFFSHNYDIQNIQMDSCFSLMLGFNSGFDLEFDAAHVINSDLRWIAVNNSKPQRFGNFSLVIHSSEEYAKAYIDYDREKVKQHLMMETSHVIGHNVSLANYQILHGWRYANNTRKGQTYDIFLDMEHKLAVCGDWCCGGRVEGAFRSAYNLANKMKEIIL